MARWRALGNLGKPTLVVRGREDAVGSAGYAGAFATISRTASGRASVSYRNDSATFTLKRPASGAKLANGAFVLDFKLDGGLSGNATVDAGVQVEVQTTATTSTGSAQRSLANQPGADSLEFEVRVQLRPDFPAGGSIRVFPVLHLDASAVGAHGRVVQRHRDQRLGPRRRVPVLPVLPAQELAISTRPWDWAARIS